MLVALWLGTGLPAVLYRVACRVVPGGEEPEEVCRMTIHPLSLAVGFMYNYYNN